MQEQLVSFETSVLAKSKGFVKTGNWMGFVDKFYHPRTGTLLSMGRTGRPPFNTLIYAPTQSLMQRWLREVHEIHINIQMLYQCNIEPAEFEGWIIYIAGESFETNYEINKDLISKVFKSYEEALEYGLFEMLKLIK